MRRKLAGVNRLKGQVLVLAIITMSVILLTTLIVFNVNQLTTNKERLQNTADAVTFSMAVVEARDMNFAAYTNRAMVANQVGISQFVGMVSWFRYFWRLSDNMIWIGRIMTGLSAIPFMQWLAAPAQVWTKLWTLIKKGAKTGQKFAESFSKLVITALDMMNKVLSYSQAVYHYASVETTINTFINVLRKNDSSAGVTAGGVVGFGAHEYQWLTKFTQWKGQPAPDDHIARFADVTMDSRDPWGVARGWNLSFISDDPGLRGPGKPPPGDLKLNLGAGISFGMYLGLGKLGGSDLVLNDQSGGSGSAPPGPGTGTWEQECKAPPACPWKYQTSAWTLEGYNATKTFNYENCNNFSSSCKGKGCTTPRNACWARNQKVQNACIAFRNGQIQACKDDQTKNPVTDPTKPPEGSGSGKGNDTQYHWAAMDTAGLQFRFSFSLDFKILKINISIPFDIPFGWGAARAGGKKFTFASWDNGEYGGASSWPVSFNAAKFEWGMRKKIGKYSGLQKYLGVKDTTADNNESPGILIEVRKPMTAVRTSNEAGIGYKGGPSGAPGAGRLYGQGGHPFDLSAQSVKYMFAVSKARAVFKPPAGGYGPADQKGNMFNPYWQASLSELGDMSLLGQSVPEKALFYFMRTIMKFNS